MQNNLYVQISYIDSNDNGNLPTWVVHLYYQFKFHKSSNGEEGISHFMLNRNMWLENKIQ
jgi:hypothetical protein